MRTFTAVEVPKALRERVGARLAPLLDGQRGVHPVTAANLHVTVRFLGDIKKAALPGLIEDLAPMVRAGQHVRRIPEPTTLSS